MMLPNSVYDTLKWIALIALDAIGVFYKSIAAIWHLPYGDEVCATFAALALCLGTLLQISSAQYKKKQEPPNNGENM